MSPANGRDYAALPGLLKIKKGQNSATLTIRPLAGGTNGNVKLTLLPDGGNYAVGAPARVKVHVGE